MIKTILIALIVIPLIWVGWALMASPSPYLLSGCLVTSMYQVDLCPDHANYVKLSDISPVLIQTILASEDSSFYSHSGFDWFEIKQSLKRDWQTHKVSRGGSTITQQLVKNVFLSGEKTLSRKIREAYLTWQVERLYSKNQILERYLNVIELGPNIFGVKAAAKYYFNKTPARIHVLEAAYLAHLLPNPKVYSNTFNKRQLTKFSHQQVQSLISRMYHFHKISSEQAETARSLIDDFPWTSLSTAQQQALMAVSTEYSTPDDNEALDQFVEGPFDAVPPDGADTDDSSVDSEDGSPPPNPDTGDSESSSDDFE